MSLFRRHRWFVAAAGITAAFAVVSWSRIADASSPLLADFSACSLCWLGVVVTVANARLRTRSERRFWGSMALGFSCGRCNQAAWATPKSCCHIQVPIPYFCRYHSVLSSRSHDRRRGLASRSHSSESAFQLSTVNFLMLLVWWIFLYAFIVFPHQYVVLQCRGLRPLLRQRFIEWRTCCCSAVLGFAALEQLRRLENASICISSCRRLIQRSAPTARLERSTPRILLRCALMTFPRSALSPGWPQPSLAARQASRSPVKSRLSKRDGAALSPQLAMLAILSLPVLGLWTFLFDNSPPRPRVPSACSRCWPPCWCWAPSCSCANTSRTRR